MDYQTIRLTNEGPLAVLEFNRPEQYNAMNPQMARELVEAVVEVAHDKGARALMLTGAGKSFHSGGDVKHFVTEGENLPASLETLVHDLHGFISRLIRLPKPVVAAVNGPAAGAGFSIAMACDLVVARADAKFTMGYTAIGASPDGSSTFSLPRLLGLRRALELALTNRVLTAAEALEWGLVSHVVAPENFAAEARALALQLAEGATAAFGRTKKLLYHSLNHDLETQMELEAREIVESTQTHDFREGTAAFVEKRKPGFKGN